MTRIKLTREALLLDAVLLAAIWYFLLPAPALAYFDLGMGTYMVQLIFGFGAAFFLSFKNDLVNKLRKKKADTATPELQVSTSNSESRTQQ